MRATAGLKAIWSKQEGHLFPWAAVSLGLGVVIYFALRVEPPPIVLAFCGLGGALLVWLGARSGAVIAPSLVALGMVSCGVAVAGLRTATVAAPVLEHRYYGPVEGRVLRIDRSANDLPRLLLDQVRLDLSRVPARVRIALPPDAQVPLLGETVALTAHLAPPAGPVEPTGFDFQRYAWFRQLGAVGYTRTPVIRLAPVPSGPSLFRLRNRINTAVKQALPGQTGQIAAALLTADKSGLTLSTLQALRDSNLAHLLAISGLHMGLLAGVVFGSLRVLLCLIPRVALRLPIKKIAAIGAWICATGYLLLSGGGVATERAYIMVAVMLGAVCLDRAAISLRSVSLAAIVLIALRPEAVTGPGFQMSFAATTALVATFGALRNLRLPRAAGWATPVVMTLVSSAVAGGATAPVAAAHFNRIADFGLIANLAATPLMGVLVIPAAMLGVCLIPFGAQSLGFIPMGWGIDWILGVATRISSYPDAVSTVTVPGTLAYGLIVSGGLILCLWQGRTRWLGALIVMLGIALWGPPRPYGLISDDGKLVGILTENGRALSRVKGAGFVAKVWLENDGDIATQAQAAARSGWKGEQGARRYDIGTLSVLHVKGKKEARSLTHCPAQHWIISDQPLGHIRQSATCHITDARSLRRSGSLSFQIVKGIPQITSVAENRGARPWAGQQRP